jgi:uncharacterized protein YecE (DUF72 family)
MLNWRLGTVGFGYDDWAGVFYPNDLKPADYLSFYAKYFDSVELDTTFHATPTAERVRRWAAATPDGFRFCVKTPKDVTHAEGSVAAKPRVGAMLEFVEAVRGFEEKLAVVLLQFPPSFHADAAKDLRTLLAALPSDVRFAVEFRHSSWDTDVTADLLREFHCGWVAADYLDREPWEVPATADFLYVRWVGRHGQYPTLDRERIDLTERLKWWKQRIERCNQIGAVWGFFNNDYAGHAVGTCNRMKRLVGQSVRTPEVPGQGQLFE